MPIGSRTLVEQGAIVASPSTVRHELSELEGLGMLGHPHTSAGRVPTTEGYRYYTALLERRGVEPRPLPSTSSGARGELDSALRLTAEALAQATDLLAAVSAPSLDTTVVRHVELVPLQPQLVMAVVITASGGVAKRLFVFEQAVDAGLLEWARDYINESIVGLRLGARTLRQRLSDPSLGTAERGILERLEPVFTQLVDEGSLYLGGAAGLLADLRDGELASLREVVSALEERLQLLAALRDVLDSDRGWIRVGDDTRRARAALPLPGGGELRHRKPQPRHGRPDRPAAHGLRGRDASRARSSPGPLGLRGGDLRHLSAQRGVTRPGRRKLGSDPDACLTPVLHPSLSGRGLRVTGSRISDTHGEAGLLRVARREPRCNRWRDQEGLPRAGPGAASGRLRGAGRRGALPRVAEAYEVLSDDDRRARYDRYGHEAVAGQGFHTERFMDLGFLDDLLGSLFGGGFAGATGPEAGADAQAAIDIDLADAQPACTSTSTSSS